MDTFITWEMLATFSILASIVFMITEFVKELKPFSYLKTKYLSWFIAFALIIVSNFVLKTFVLADVILYSISAIAISLTANGLYDFNKKVTDERDTKKVDKLE